MKMQQLRGVIAALALVFSFSIGDAFAVTYPDPSIPEASDNGSARDHGKKNSLYFYIRDENGSALSSSKIDTIRSRETTLRRYMAENSGGVYDVYYDQILDIPMALDSNGRRPSNWLSQAESYAASNYGVSLSSYYAHVFDVSATTPDVNQGWAGIYYGGQDSGRDLALQSQSTGTLIHEFGHRASADHASSWRGLNTGGFSSYVWSSGSQAYVPYVQGSQPHDPMPFGVYRDEYGNPFDTMGNISDGHIRLREKASDLDWIDDERIPSLNSLGEGTYRIYAHDEAQAIYDSANDTYGVQETYRDDVNYGLTFTRNAYQLDTSGSDTGTWNTYTQRIDLEYRSGSDGVLFYLDSTGSNQSVLLDMDPQGGTSRSNRERALEVGNAVEDISFGMHTYTVNDDDDPDFLSYNPIAPNDTSVLRSQWFHISVLSTGADSKGSFAELEITLVSPLNGIEGDLNQDNDVDLTDFNLFVDGWLTDTSSLTTPEKYLFGDMNFDGITDLKDAFLMRLALIDNNVSLAGESFFAQVPEPTASVLLLAGVLSWCGRRGTARRC